MEGNGEKSMENEGWHFSHQNTKAEENKGKGSGREDFFVSSKKKNFHLTNLEGNTIIVFILPHPPLYFPSLTPYWIEGIGGKSRKGLKRHNFLCLDNKFRGGGFQRKRFEGSKSRNLVNNPNCEKN